MSFHDLNERHRQLAGVLSGAGLKAGDRVAILARNHPSVIEIVSGALRAGIIPVLVNSLLTEPEVDYILDDSQARWLFTDRHHELRPTLDRVVRLGDAYERELAEASPVDIADHILSRPMHYTSGTTGAPKGVHTPLLKAEAAAVISFRFAHTWGLTPEDVHLVCSPLAHSAPLRFAIRTLEAGGSVVVPERFDPEATLAAIDLFGVTSTFMVPTHIERLLALGRSKIARFDLGSLRLLAHAGAPIRIETKRELIDVLPPGSVWEFYGSTEGQATRISTEEWLRKPGSVGLPYEGGKIYVMSPDFEPLPGGEVGQVWVLDPNAEEFAYWDDPDRTAAAWQDGAFHVGDLGWLDEDGYLYLTGRADDTIITGGVNVYPAEVEQALSGHPGVSAVLVWGVSSEEWGQEVQAAVVPLNAEDFDSSELTRWAKERLASFKIPKHIEVVPELPQTPTGKSRRPKP